MPYRKVTIIIRSSFTFTAYEMATATQGENNYTAPSPPVVLLNFSSSITCQQLTPHIWFEL